MLAFARRVMNELGKSAVPDVKEISEQVEEPQAPALDGTSTASATDRVEGGKAVEPRPRDPLRDKFDRILLGLE
jgi:hypothetical protein